MSRPKKNFARCNELSQPPLRQNGLVMSIMQSTEKVAPKNNERLVLNIKVLTAPMVIIFQSLTKLKPLEEIRPSMWVTNKISTEWLQSCSF